MTGSGAPHYHFLIGPTGSPVEIGEEKHFFIGRTVGNDIVAEDTRASRRHAELYWDGAKIILMDLDSSNGTFVNGNQIHTTALEDGDVIEIGLQAFTYRCVRDRNELSTIFKSIQKESRQMITQQLPTLEMLPGHTDFSGTLASISLPDLFQFLNLARRKGLLLIRGESGKASVYFDNGEAVHAVYGSETGEDAIFQLLAESNRGGHFSFKGAGETAERSITLSLTQLLLEAARRGDEGGR